MSSGCFANANACAGVNSLRRTSAKSSTPALASVNESIYLYNSLLLFAYIAAWAVKILLSVVFSSSNAFLVLEEALLIELICFLRNASASSSDSSRIAFKYFNLSSLVLRAL